MQKFKRKRHLTAVVVAFISLLAIGGVLASATGILDIRGVIQIGDMGELEVQWIGATMVTATNVDYSVLIQTTPDAANMTPARANDRIAVSATFNAGEEGILVIRSQVRNTGDLTAILHADRVPAVVVDFVEGPSGPNAFGGHNPATDWGLQVTADWSHVFGGSVAENVTLAPDTTAPGWVYIEIYWAGIEPTGTTNWDVVGGDNVVSGVFYLTFDYTAA